MIDTKINYCKSTDLPAVELHIQLMEELSEKPKKDFEDAMASEIIKKFKSGQSYRWKKTTYKIKPRNRILIETGELLKNTNDLVKDLQKDREIINNNSSVQLNDVLNYYDSSPYIYYHEMGIGVPQRSFLKDAIEKCLNLYAAEHKYVNSMIDSHDNKVSSVYIQDGKVISPGGVSNLEQVNFYLKNRSEPDKNILKSLFNIYPIWTIFIPPNMIWKLIGQALDVKGIIEGRVNTELLESYLIAYFAAKSGMTGKQQKRNLRQRLWY